MPKKVFQTIFAIGTKLNPTFSKGMLSASKRMGEVQKQSTALGRQTKAIKRFKELDSAVDKAGGEFNDATADLKRLRAEARKSPAVTAKMRSGIAKAEKAVTRTKTALDKKRFALKKTGRALTEAGVDVRKLTAAEKRLAIQTDKLARKQARLARIASAKLGERFRNIGGAARSLGRSLSIVGAASTGVAFGLFSIAKSTAAAGDDAAKTAAQIGITSEALQELRFAAERSGVSTSDLDNSFRLMIRNMGEAQRGTGRQAEAFQELGLDAARLSRLNPEKAFELIADQMAKIPNLAKRASIGQQIFGRASGKMTAFLGLGTEALNELRQAGRDTGNVLSRQVTKDAETFTDSMLGAKFSLLGVKNTLGAELMPAFTGLFDRLSRHVKDNRKQIKVWAADFARGFQENIPVVIQFGSDLGSLFARIVDGTRKVAAFVGGFENLAIVLVGLKFAPLIASVVSLGKSLLVTTGLVGGLGTAIVSFGLAGTAAAGGAITLGLAVKGLGLAFGKLAAVFAVGAAFAGLTFLITDTFPKLLGFKRGLGTFLGDLAFDFLNVGDAAKEAAGAVDGALTVLAKTKKTQKELDALAQTYLDVITEAQETEAGAAAGLGISGALAEGIRQGTPAALAELETALKQAREFLPSSDAKRGPLSNLTAAGRAIPETMGVGIAQASGALTAPLTAALQPPGAGAAAGPGRAAAGAQVTIHAPITIQGNASPEAARGIAMAGQELTDRIERTIRAMFAEQGRVSFGV